MAALGYGETPRFWTAVTDKATGLIAAAPDLTLKLKYDSVGDTLSVATTRYLPADTSDPKYGWYYADHTTTHTGRLYGRWDTDGNFDTAKEFVIFIRRSPFEESNLSDYN